MKCESACPSREKKMPVPVSVLSKERLCYALVLVSSSRDLPFLGVFQCETSLSLSLGFVLVGLYVHLT